MLAKVKSGVTSGIDASLVEVEVDISMSTLRQVIVVGLPDTAVKESKDRVKAAITNSGYYFPGPKITVNLAPADARKEGPLYDLPIAIGLLVASEQASAELLKEYAIIGELALDGAVRPVKGTLPISLAVRDANLKGIIVPEANATEAGVVKGVDAIPVRSLAEAVGFLNGKLRIQPYTVNLEEVFEKARNYDVDFSEVKGQEHVKRALTVAAAGGHNIIMIGPPGSGKTMLARRLPTILPNLTLEESLETTKIYSVAGLLPPGTSIMATRPFRSPHHTISDAGMVGGGAVIHPGEVSLSHNGVLFLDELPEFTRRSLEGLRQPLEDGHITISRATSSTTFPAKIMLVAAMNPCPCGYHGDPRRNCRCSPHDIERYRSKISGPLLDRIDIHVEVPSVRHRELSSRAEGISSAELRKVVIEARRIQYQRFKGTGIFVNAQMTTKMIKKYCQITSSSEALIHQAMEEMGLSARAYSRILKVARTIADMEGASDINETHIGESVQYRTLDRERVL